MCARTPRGGLTLVKCSPPVSFLQNFPFCTIAFLPEYCVTYGGVLKTGLFFDGLVHVGFSPLPSIRSALPLCPPSPVLRRELFPKYLLMRPLFSPLFGDHFLKLPGQFNLPAGVLFNVRPNVDLPRDVTQ